MTKREFANLKPGDRVLLRLPKEPESAFNGAKAKVVRLRADGIDAVLGSNPNEEPIIFDRTEIHLITG